jgi:hypothetical protein
VAIFDEVRAEYPGRESEYSAAWQRAAGSSQDVLNVMESSAASSPSSYLGGAMLGVLDVGREEHG